MGNRDISFVIEDNAVGKVEWTPPPDVQRVINALNEEQRVRTTQIVEYLLLRLAGLVMAVVSIIERPQKFDQVLIIISRGINATVRQVSRALRRT